MDQLAITAAMGRELPPLRNFWSDRLWLGTVTVSTQVQVQKAASEEHGMLYFGRDGRVVGLTVEFDLLLALGWGFSDFVARGFQNRYDIDAPPLLSEISRAEIHPSTPRGTR